MTLATQKTFAPTNKLMVGSVVAAGLTEGWRNVMEIYFPPISGPEFSIMVGALGAVAVSWWVKDRVNIPDVTQE